MIAFYSNGKNQIKAYLHHNLYGSSWQLIDDTGKERWFSVWQANPKESLHSAFNRFLGYEIQRNQIAGLADKLPI
jgi:hypothetical protein